MDDGRLLRLVEPGKVRHGGVEPEEAVERQSGTVAGGRQGKARAQRDIAGIADRRHGREPVERAAQHHDDKARIAPAGGEGVARRETPGEERAGSAEDGAAARMDGVLAEHGLLLGAAQRRWTSGLISRIASPWARLSARATA